MPFDWNEFLQICKDLESDALVASSVNKCGKHRSSISRGYYAAFHIAAEYAKAEFNYVLPNHPIQLNGKKMGSHEHLIESFILNYSSTGNVNYNIIAIKLGNLKRKRHKADYKPLVYPNLSTLVSDNNQAITLAEDIINLCV